MFTYCSLWFIKDDIYPTIKEAHKWIDKVWNEHYKKDIWFLWWYILDENNNNINSK